MEGGGWNPVIQRRRVGSQNGSQKEAMMIVTIFVDNIPDSMGPKGLFNLFRKFGLVKDVFILGKRRKASRSRFGANGAEQRRRWEKDGSGVLDAARAGKWKQEDLCRGSSKGECQSGCAGGNKSY
ncbi:hypothetical protein ACSBR2_042227 [Camellia fascicularis]